MAPLTLTAGTRFGPYEILSALGAGGMGEVYRARDTKLNRDVALKILLPAVANDPDRLARFSREAQVLASLNHPNIAHIHGLEESGGVRALVMELVEGPTLADRIATGAIPLDEALPIAKQIADALEAAHESGIIHRDLKPANIKVRLDGMVKVLDFGLAKAMDPAAASGANASMSPTISMHATQAGIILGTAAYMSPEQAKGRTVDKRADIWAFGVVLYEMLTGGRAFKGEDISETLASVLKDTPDFRALPANTPPGLRRLIERCLQRDVKNRLRDIGDARIVLDEISRGGASPDAPATVATSRASRPTGITAAAAVTTLAIGLVAGRWMWNRNGQAGAAPALVRLSVPAPAGVTAVSDVAVSPDGTFVVFMGTGTGDQQLYLRRLDELAPRPIDRTVSASQPFVSPDGKWIGFVRSNHLEKIAVSGGEPIRIADMPTETPGHAWGTDGTILVTTSWYGGLSAVSANGGTLRPMTTVDAAHGEKGHFFPRFLPDGRHALFTIFRSAGGLNDAQMAVVDVSSGKYQVIMPGAHGSYVAPGFLVFYRAGAYQAVRFDLESLKPSGEPVTVLTDDRGIKPDGSRPTLSLAANGTLAYVPGSFFPSNTLTWIADGGKAENLAFAARSYLSARLSPSGRQIIASNSENGGYVVRLLDLDRRTDDVLDLPGINWNPLWYPDGHRIAMLTMQKGDFDIYVKDTTASGPATPLLATPLDEEPLAWASDKKLIISQSAADGRYRLKLLDLDAPDRTSVLSDNSPDTASVSPDGRWVAFADRHTGRYEVSIRLVAGDGLPERITADGGATPVWSRHGRELYYKRANDIVAATWREDANRFKVDRERVWAHLDETTQGNTGTSGLAGAASDGRLLVVLPKDPPLPPQVRVILNWQDELSRKLAR